MMALGPRYMGRLALSVYTIRSFFADYKILITSGCSRFSIEIVICRDDAWFRPFIEMLVYGTNDPPRYQLPCYVARNYARNWYT